MEFLRKWTNSLREKSEFLYKEGEFSFVSIKKLSFYPYEVTEVY